MKESRELSRFSFQPLPEKPLVSVLLSSYNYAAYVGEALRSVFCQTYTNLELVVVDDGSTDQSVEVIRDALRATEIAFEFVTQENGGQASAWNAGYPLCRGDLVCFLDSDDSWRPEKLANMVAFARAHPDAGLYQHQLDNAAGDLKKPKLLDRDILRDWVAVREIDVQARNDLIAIFLPSSGLMARHEVLDKVFPIPVQLITCPDAFLTRMCCIYGPLRSNPEVLGSWRSHPANAGKSSRFSFDEYWVPTVMPAINEGFRARGISVQFVYRAPIVEENHWTWLAKRLGMLGQAKE